MNIPVVIVDNAAADRFIARRRFSRAEGFGKCIEYPSGTDFIRNFQQDNAANGNDEPATTVVLMDISMPEKNGFEVIDEYLSQASDSPGASKLIFVMYTSSDAAIDREQAAAMRQVSGYVLKPLRPQDVDHIREIAS